MNGSVFETVFTLGNIKLHVVKVSDDDIEDDMYCPPPYLTSNTVTKKA